MGGSGSKEEEAPKDASLRENIPIKGLKNGDVISLKGELGAHLGISKFFVVNLMNGDDIAFHFKVIFLNAENQFNAVKMNTRIGGTWGEEILIDNVIFLNHFFQLKVTCLQDKFVVEIDGNHFSDYTHRVSPEKITLFETEGFTGFTEVEVPNRISPAKIQFVKATEDANQHFPTPTEIQLFVQNLVQNTPAPPASSKDEEMGRLSDLITDGLNITNTLLEEKKGGFLKNAAKYGGYLFGVFRGGQAVFGIINFIAKYGQPSDTEKVMEKLNEINEELKKLESTIEQGFAEVVEHMDLVQFREDVKIPLRTMFDLYVRCYTVNGKLPVEDFKNYCKEKNSPRAVFSAMYEFLDSRKNIFETHLKTKKYVYSVYDEWSTAIYNYATKLIVMNMFLLGILSEEYAAAGHKDRLIDEEQETANLISHLVRMDDRLNEIEAARMKTFHTEGQAKAFLTEMFNKVEYPRGRADKPLPDETLAIIAHQMKTSWKGFNGPEDYYIMVVRGRYGKEKSGESRRYAGWHVANPEKITVVENIGQVSEYAKDFICLALIQPITKEDREANEKVYSDQKEKLKEIVEHVRAKEYKYPSSTLPKILEFTQNVAPFKPLLIMYNTDYSISTAAFAKEKFEMVPISYEMTSESWSGAGGPLPLKYRWTNPTVHVHPSWYIHIARREVQIVFQ